MKLLKVLMLITVLSFSFSLNNVSAGEGDFESLHKKYPNAIDKLKEDTGDFEELQKIYPNAVDMLTEGSKKEAEELEQKVLEDMKNNPDKVKFAVPVDVKQDDSVGLYVAYYTQ